MASINKSRQIIFPNLAEPSLFYQLQHFCSIFICMLPYFISFCKMTLIYLKVQTVKICKQRLSESLTSLLSVELTGS